MVAELGRSYGHLRRAAGHAADGAVQGLGRARSTTSAAISPLYDQIREGRFRRETKFMKTKMMGTKSRLGLVGLLAAGAVVGAVGAMFARRRRTISHFHQYDPGIDDIGFADSAAETGPLSATTKKVAAGAAAVAGTVSSQAGKIAETLHERTTPGSPGSGPGTAGGGSGPAAGPSTISSSTSSSSSSAKSPTPTPGRTDESARTLAGKSAGRSPFSSFASSDESGGNSPRP
jgi:hypothetical protein